jgi:hypothetical protein
MLVVDPDRHPEGRILCVKGNLMTLQVCQPREL